ncbi:unnamed protein product [Parascedosporium putredinis]|uniref:Ubiquitin 3 binding protein But2 C-terminal domain-containing protein n=1 Tax=Parascedosporium putredinis TaxID=1442378 RepID=A0A9P1H1E5_9PEZI|nr:unnamed protein product [Parascedosporium putredinis]CAI7992660.1 unnamed protein product [Parascedosporium putredinis]
MQFFTLFAAAAAVVSAAPAAPEARQINNNVVYPAATYRRWIQTGDMVLDPQDQLLIVKNGNAADETSTLVTFDFDASTAGKTCELRFELWDRDVPPNPNTVSVEEGIAQLTAAAVKSRDHHVGRIVAPKPGNATWVQAYDGWPSIPCPAGQLIAVEYVGVGDNVEVRWDIGVTGPTFLVRD